MAPATPPPSWRSLFAALTMASVSMSVRSPCWMTIFSESPLVILCGFLIAFLISSLLVAYARHWGEFDRWCLPARSPYRSTRKLPCAYGGPPRGRPRWFLQRFLGLLRVRDALRFAHCD